ncbi:MAG: hypothetical protein FWG39_03300 [Alphaproteobacteria bacterium]|nr:hypothetical protein [Alphaproteobacteria bacterium]
MPYDKNIHHRKTIRLTEYDYSACGLYFITICTHEKQCIFGHVKNGEMILNEHGRIARDKWFETSTIRPDIELLAFIVMPNHIHGIICIKTNNGGVCNTPLQNSEFEIDNAAKIITRRGVLHTPQLRSPSNTVGAIIRGYKSSVSKQIGRSVFQRNYYEHIIRNADDYDQIRGYIACNPQTWDSDKLYQKQLVEFNKS